jgi:glucans biosynthesis protein C
MNTNSNISGQKADRQNYIDWLRSGAMFLLVFYHTGRLFDEPGWHIKNAVLNMGIEVFNRFLDVWHMPLFFLLAGASVWFALKKRSGGGFAGERVLRLFVPLVFGMLIIVPPQVYYERIFDGDFTGNFLAWYPHTFQGAYSMDNPASGNLSWHHLWFLVYLFVFSLILLPAFLYFHNEKRKPFLARLSAFLAKPGVIFLPAVVLIIINLTLRDKYGWGNQNLISDWANFLYYLTVFFYGFILVSDTGILTIVQRNKLAALILAIFLTGGMVLIMSGTLDMKDSLLGPLFYTVNALACWCWLVTIIGYGSLALNFSNKLLKYASQAVMPVYVLHQTLIITIGFYVIQWNTGVAAKYFFIAPMVIVSSLIVYEIVRRTRVTRFLFGIKSPAKNI